MEHREFHVFRNFGKISYIIVRYHDKDVITGPEIFMSHDFCSV
jgi:hypothetical protein